MPRAGEAMHPFPGCSVISVQCRPESRGWLRIQSPDPAQPPKIQANYLSTQTDRETVIAGIKVSRQIFQSKAMQGYVSEEFLPGKDVTKDEDLLAHVRATGGTVFHPAGTCMMGPQPPAVVDPTLRVHGNRGLACHRRRGDADPGVGQYECGRHHDRREGRRPDPGGCTGLTAAAPFSELGATPGRTDRSPTHY
jgi:hypothetical protein